MKAFRYILKRVIFIFVFDLQALELFMPVVDKNKALRIEAYQIRAEAYRQINENVLSTSDLKSVDLLMKTNLCSL